MNQLYIYPLFFFGFPSHLGNHRASSISLYHRVGSHLLFTVYIASIAYTGKSLTSQFPPWYPYLFFLHLCLYFCFANKNHWIFVLWTPAALLSTNTQLLESSGLTSNPPLRCRAWELTESRKLGPWHLVCLSPLRACCLLLPDFQCLRNQYFTFFCLFIPLGVGQRWRVRFRKEG